MTHFEAIVTDPARGRRGIEFKIDGSPVSPELFTQFLTHIIAELKDFNSQQYAHRSRGIQIIDKQ